MTSDEKIMQKWLPKNKDKPTPSVFENLRRDWYLDWWLPKLLYVLGFLAILWKLFDITILGRFP